MTLQFIIHQIRSPSLRGLLALSLPACLPRSVHTVLRALTPFWRERRGEEGKGVALSHLANVSLLRDRFFSVKRPNKGRRGGREGDRANTIERHLGNCNGLDSRGKRSEGRPRGHRVAYTFFSSSSSGGNVNRAEVSIDILHVCLRVVPIAIGGQDREVGVVKCVLH